MDQAPGGPDIPAKDSGPPSCYRHPGRETGIRCARCERPICPECMISASVGFQCPDCVRSGSGTGHSPGANTPRTLAGGAVTAGDPSLVTKILIGLNAAVFLGVLVLGNRFTYELVLIGDAPFFPGEGVADGQWYRLLTSAFLHQEIWHFGLNMVALWFLGPSLETVLGRGRFLALFLLSALAGSVLFYILDPYGSALGASGAVFGLFGATAVLLRRLQQPMGPLLVLLAVNLIFTFTVPGIAWQGHIGGLVVGTAVAYAFVHAPRERRALVHRLVGLGTLVLLIAGIVVRTLTL